MLRKGGDTKGRATISSNVGRYEGWYLECRWKDWSLMGAGPSPLPFFCDRKEGREYGRFD
jgi:hypothetical protein